jgi:hypothetical protein
VHLHTHVHGGRKQPKYAHNGNDRETQGQLDTRIAIETVHGVCHPVVCRRSRRGSDRHWRLQPRPRRRDGVRWRNSDVTEAVAYSGTDVTVIELPPESAVRLSESRAKCGHVAA